ncbi:MAG TPA: phage tail protein, partial [candidate division Zixibacteria bacterium]|nr:phage tail protein [candidate division Zixibacteria bacterium]
KTNIQPLQGSLARVMKLQGVSYDQKEGGKHDIGLIAEEVGQVVPEVVAYEDNGVDAKSIDYARLTALLIEAVKEQQSTISGLQAQIDELKKVLDTKALK